MHFTPQGKTEINQTHQEIINWDDRYDGKDPSAVRYIREALTRSEEATFLESEEKSVPGRGKQVAERRCQRRQGVFGWTKPEWPDYSGTRGWWRPGPLVREHWKPPKGCRGGVPLSRLYLEKISLTAVWIWERKSRYGGTHHGRTVLVQSRVSSSGRKGRKNSKGRELVTTAELTDLYI